MGGERDGGASTGPRPARSDAELDALLGEYDEAVLSRDQARAARLAAEMDRDRARMPDIVSRRLVEGRFRLPELGLDLLQQCAGSAAPAYLTRVADDASARDVVRLVARWRVGWPENGEPGEPRERLAFLRSLGDPDGGLADLCFLASRTWPQQAAVYEEVLAYLLLLPPERAREIVERVAREAGEKGSWLLHALLHVQGETLQRIALDALARDPQPGAAGALDRLALTAPDPRVRAEAAAAANRARLRAGGEEQPSEPMPWPIRSTLISALDGMGGQTVFVIRTLEPGLSLVVNFVHDEVEGVGRPFTSAPLPDETIDTLIGATDEEMPLLEVSPAVVRGALHLGVEAASEGGIDPVFELWEPLAHESYPPPPGESVELPELDDAPYAGRGDLLDESAVLLDHPYFLAWQLRPDLAEDETARAFREERGMSEDAGVLEWRLNEEIATRLRRRLRRQAWVLDRGGYARERDIALAVAASLSSALPEALVGHPFVRALAQAAMRDLLRRLDLD